MDTWQTGLLVLFAVLAGTTIPLLVQALFTLRTVGRAADRIAERGETALRSLDAAAKRVDQVVTRFEREQHLDLLLEGIDSFARIAAQARDAVRVGAAVGAAVGPAVGAAVKAWRSQDSPDGAKSREGLEDRDGDSPRKETRV